VTAIPDADAKQRIALSARRITDSNPAVRDDAFLELAKATDRDLFASRENLSAERLRQQLDNPRTPSEQIGLYALLLGICGEVKDRQRFERWLAATPPLPDSVADNLSGILAGYIRLEPQQAWPQIERMLREPNRPIAERLSIITTVRYFHANDPASTNAVLECYRAVVQQGELADLGIEELRRLKAWHLAVEILTIAERPKVPPIVRRAILRYALHCPDGQAQAYVRKAREREPKLVLDVEEGLKVLENR
jgi:hypothetical protein